MHEFELMYNVQWWIPNFRNTNNKIVTRVQRPENMFDFSDWVKCREVFKKTKTKNKSKAVKRLEQKCSTFQDFKKTTTTFLRHTMLSVYRVANLWQMQWALPIIIIPLFKQFLAEWVHLHKSIYSIDLI